jgi:hypothetical protein
MTDPWLKHQEQRFSAQMPIASCGPMRIAIFGRIGGAGRKNLSANMIPISLAFPREIPTGDNGVMGVLAPASKAVMTLFLISHKKLSPLERRPAIKNVLIDAYRF